MFHYDCEIPDLQQNNKNEVLLLIQHWLQVAKKSLKVDKHESKNE